MDCNTINMIEILSDIHSEMATLDNVKLLCDNMLTPLIKEKTDIILAGDIGNPLSDNYKYIIQHCSDNYNRVFICTGNHEYYHSFNITHTEYYIDKLCIKYNNVYFLNKTRYEFEDFVILGCTLWTRVPHKFKYVVSKCMNDYKYIPDFDVTVQNNLHENHINWLKSEIEQIDTDKNVIVVTHHLPTFELIDDIYKDSDINHAFANTDCNELFQFIDYWICGHTHMYKNIVIEDCTFIVNPLGYSGENTKFSQTRIL